MYFTLSQVLTKPLITHEVGMPVNSPGIAIPTLCSLFFGWENYKVIGTNICGIMEQMLVMSDVTQMM